MPKGYYNGSFKVDDPLKEITLVKSLLLKGCNLQLVAVQKDRYTTDMRWQYLAVSEQTVKEIQEVTADIYTW